MTPAPTMATRHGIARRMREMPRRSQISLLAAQVLLAILVLSPNAPLARVPDEDAGVFLYVARTIQAGGAPYRDVFDHKPPGVYLIDLLGGANQWGVFALQLIALGAASWISYRALERGGLGRYGALFGTMAWIFAVPRLTLADGRQTNFPELFALPLQVLALGLFAGEESRPRPTWRTAAIGASGAAALLLKPTVVGIWVAIGLVLVFTRLRSNGWSDLARRGLLIVAPAAALLGVVGVWLASRGALADAIDQTIRYNAIYSGYQQPLDRLAAIATGLRLTLPSGLAVLGVLGWTIAAFRGPRPPLVILALVALPIEMAFSSAGRGYYYYFLSWLPAMGVLAGFLCARLRERLGRHFSHAMLAGGVAMSIVPAILIGRLIPIADDGVSRGVAAYVASATRPDDTVLIWGSRTEILLLADRRSPTRYIYQYAALATRDYASAARIDEFVADLARARPVLIVDASTNSFGTPPLDRAGFAVWTSPDAQYEWPTETVRILDFVEANYERVGTLPQRGWPIWRLRARSVTGSESASR